MALNAGCENFYLFVLIYALLLLYNYKPYVKIETDDRCNHLSKLTWFKSDTIILKLKLPCLT